MKFKDFTSIFAPLLSMFVLMNGIGLLGTFIPIRLEFNHVSSWDIGLVTSAYYGGMVLGAFRNAHFILRVGHIRAYAAFASIIAVVVLSQGLFYSLWYWVALRAICGYCLSGLYIVVESWMLGKSTPKIRGKFLSLYMISLYGASALGQLLLNLFPVEALIPFAIVTILSSLSVVPVAITKVDNPTIEEPSALTVFQLYRLSPTGIVTCTCSGLIMGSVLGLLPLYTQLTIDSIKETSLIMFFLIFGGTLLQYPVGHLSDKFDRRKMIIALCCVLSVIGFIIMMLSKDYLTSIYVLIFAFGGAAFAVYPVSISHTCDVLDQKDIVSATQGLMLAYGVGAVLGPILASTSMNLFGSIGLFLYFCLIAGGLAAYLGHRIMVQAPPKGEDQQEFVLLPGTSPVASELDPRSD